VSTTTSSVTKTFTERDYYPGVEYYYPGVEYCALDYDGAEAHILAGNLSCILLGAVFVFVVSMPLCCGFLKQRADYIAGVVVPLGILICCIPFLANRASCNALTDDSCEACRGGCTEQTRARIHSECTDVWQLLVHIYFGGWIGILLGIVASSLGCCIWCKCGALKPHMTAADIPPGGLTVGPPEVVMGSAVGVGNEKA